VAPRPSEPPSRQVRQSSLTEHLIDGYNRLRLLIALSAIALLAILALTGLSRSLVLFNVLGLAVMGGHAAWSQMAGIRSPRFALILDITVVNAAAAYSVSLPASAISLAVWVILITFMTYGRWRYLLYGYAGSWYLVLVGRAAEAPDWPVTVSVLFVAAVAAAVLSRVHRHVAKIEMQRAQLLGSVSHELRNQLTGVIGMVDLALDESAALTPADVRDMVGLARREALDAADLIEDLLTSSSMERGSLEVAAAPIDVAAEATRIAIHYPKDGSRIEVLGDTEGIKAMADEIRLRQVLRNLLSNAARHGGASIAVETARVGSEVQVRVSDDGPGVPPGEEETIFLPYRRAANTPRHHSSVGLGLWISRQLARTMGGDLTYHRIANRTTFQLSLPAVIDEAEHPLPAGGPAVG
jgi:signal transduction histidine kinase